MDLGRRWKKQVWGEENGERLGLGCMKDEMLVRLLVEVWSQRLGMSVRFREVQSQYMRLEIVRV